MAAKPSKAGCLLIRIAHSLLRSCRGQPHEAAATRHKRHVHRMRCCLPHAHTHVLSPSLSLPLSLFYTPAPCCPQSLSFCLPQLICIILIWHFCPRRRQAPGGGHIKAFTWKHIQLHAICINCSVLSLSQRLSLLLLLLLLLLSLPVSLNYCHLISAITTHFCATICPLSCLAFSLFVSFCPAVCLIYCACSLLSFFALRRISISVPAATLTASFKLIICSALANSELN